MIPEAPFTDAWAKAYTRKTQAVNAGSMQLRLVRYLRISNDACVGGEKGNLQTRCYWWFRFRFRLALSLKAGTAVQVSMLGLGFRV